MADAPADVSGTFLTERQAEILELRHRGLTQPEIAERLGTSVANVSAVEKSARTNVERARRTDSLARLLRSAVRFTAAEGTDLRDVVDRVYEHGNRSDVKVTYGDPELTTYLRSCLGDRLDGNVLTATTQVGITPDGDVVTHPSVSPPGRDHRPGGRV